MPSKKKKYNARFPAGRIKKIMQTDDEVGKVAQAVPVIISRTLELFVESLITKTMEITTMKNARTLSPHHMKQCIISEKRFDFLKDLVKSVPEAATSDTDDVELPSGSQSRRRDSQDLLRIDEDAEVFQSGPSGQATSLGSSKVDTNSGDSMSAGENGTAGKKDCSNFTTKVIPTMVMTFDAQQMEPMSINNAVTVEGDKIKFAATNTLVPPLCTMQLTIRPNLAMEPSI